jgi:hypothetical protein
VGAVALAYAVDFGKTTLAQRRKDFLAPEIDHFGNIGAEGNADRNLREFLAGRQRK